MTSDTSVLLLEGMEVGVSSGPGGETGEKEAAVGNRRRPDNKQIFEILAALHSL